MKKLALSLLLLATALVADFQTGLDAYKRGDFAAAVKEWQPIAERGDPNAQYNLGMLYARGQGVAQDYKQAADWYRKAADQGVAAAQYNLGLMYANGQGVAQSGQEAAQWFLKAAEQGVSMAEEGLGRVYYEEGAFRNYGEAEKWYRKAADQGIASAAFDLAVMYDLGQGVQQSYSEALKLYQKAADQGYAPALTNIGILYYNQQGVKRDLVQAYAWFSRAQKLGDPRAGDLLAATSKRMKPGDIKKAVVVADNWKPSQPSQPQVAEATLFKAPQTPTAPPAGASTAEAKMAPTASSAAAPPAAPVESAKTLPQVQDSWTGVERIVAVGDVHGDYEQFALVLQSAGLIDGNANWIGGKTHLVQTGDVVDRGPNARAVMDLLIRLEKQAAAAGGGVHSLIGNHEAMDVYGDLRYVSPAEFASFRPDGAGASREAAGSDGGHSVTAAATLEPGAGSPDAAHTPGFAEMRAAFGPDGEYGRWIRSNNAVIKIGRTLFVHAGLGAKYTDWSLDRINNEVRQELTDFTRLHGGVVTDPDGPLWSRSLAKGDEAATAPVVDQLLKQFDVDRIVIGHSYANAAITPRFGGKVVLIDIGLPRVYDNVGKLGCLEIDGAQAWAVHRGQKLALPKDENGPDMLRYLKEAAALDPRPSPLLPRIAALEKAKAQ